MSDGSSRCPLFVTGVFFDRKFDNSIFAHPIFECPFVFMNTLPLRKKNISVMLCVALLFFAGYYCIYTMPIDMSREICMVSSSALLGFCIFGEDLLLPDALDIRSRRIFMLQMWLVGLVVGVFAVILYQNRRYISWCRKDYPAGGCMDLDSPDYYLLGYFLTLISIMIVISVHNPQIMLVHGLCFLLLFCFLFYNTRQQESPALSGLSADDDSVGKSSAEFLLCLQQLHCEQTDAVDSKYRFVDKIPEYKVILEDWMQIEKPYKNKDFKLLDVMTVLPLNRSYLSRMFNEGYNETFFDFVMRYRIDESAELLLNHPDFTAAYIAHTCGFSSPSVFGRAFLKNKGMTPKEYRNR